MLGGEAPAAVLDRSVDPAQTGVVPGGGVGLGGGHDLVEVLAVDLLQHVQLVAALAPDELLVLGVQRGDGRVEERLALGEQLVDRDHVGHRVPPGDDGPPSCAGRALGAKRCRCSRLVVRSTRCRTTRPVPTAGAARLHRCPSSRRRPTCPSKGASTSCGRRSPTTATPCCTRLPGPGRPPSSRCGSSPSRGSTATASWCSSPGAWPPGPPPTGWRACSASSPAPPSATAPATSARWGPTPGSRS